MDRLSILRRFQIGLTGTFSKGLSYEKLMRTGIASYDGMKSLNLKVALILLTIGAVLLMISVTPYQGGMICTLTEDACAQVDAQARQAAAAQFFEFFFSGVALMSIAAIFLITGRNRGPSSLTSPP